MPQGVRRVKVSVTIHIETLWTNRADLSVEAEVDNPNSTADHEVISMMFDAARLMTAEAHGENERALFSQTAINSRHRELDDREARLDERDKRVTSREATATTRDGAADDRENNANRREREEMEREVRSQRQE
jgi:uncharacterized protein (DUF3084 family)